MMIVNFAGQFTFLHPGHLAVLDYDGRRHESVQAAFEHMGGDHLVFGDTEMALRMMDDVVFTKFFEDKAAMDLLRGVADDLLIFGNCACDNFWGRCFCGKCFQIQNKSLNHYGEILMRVRDLLVQK